MNQLVQQCLSGVRHPLVAGGIGLALGLGLGLLAPGLGLVVSIGPLLAILLCLLPCLVPLLLLRRRGGAENGPMAERPAVSLTPGGNDPPPAR
jgi:hypothetical protein